MGQCTVNFLMKASNVLSRVPQEISKPENLVDIHVIVKVDPLFKVNEFVFVCLGCSLAGINPHKIMFSSHLSLKICTGGQKTEHFLILIQPKIVHMVILVVLNFKALNSNCSLFEIIQMLLLCSSVF